MKARRQETWRGISENLKEHSLDHIVMDLEWKGEVVLPLSLGCWTFGRVVKPSQMLRFFVFSDSVGKKKIFELWSGSKFQMFIHRVKWVEKILNFQCASHDSPSLRPSSNTLNWLWGVTSLAPNQAQPTLHLVVNFTSSVSH